MNRVLIAIAAFVLWSAAAFGAGWAWRGDRAETVQATQQGQAATGAAQAQATARTTEHQQAATLAEIGDKHEQDRQAAESVPDAVVADLRAGTLQLRHDLATCSTARLSDAVAGTVQRDAPGQLRDEVAGAAVRIARDADDQLRAAQAVIRADRPQARQ
jgi:hypothetical protein